MSVTTLQPAVVVFREEQNFAWWIYALVTGMLVGSIVVLFWTDRGAAASRPVWALSACLGIGLPLVLLVFVLRMTTEVAPGRCTIWFGWVPSYRQSVPVSSIERIEVVTYRPVRDYGGWGIRRGADGERVLNARGDRGVRLTLRGGGRLLIGSQKPEDLAQAIEDARRAAA